MLLKNNRNLLIILSLILFEVGFGITINLVGTISLSELISFIYTIFYIKSSNLLKNNDFKKIFLLYVLLIISQILSEILVGNNINNSLKGISIPIISFCHTFILLQILNRSPKLIIWLLTGIIIRIVIFPSAVEGNTTEALSGEDAAFLKFVIAPILINLLLIYSILKNRTKNYILFIGLGTMLITLGARSSGVITFLTGLITLFLKNRKYISLTKLRLYIIFIGIIGYSAYCLYTNMVITGKINSGNSAQLKQVENPYNPINLLMMGRTETFVGAMAFLEKPFTGWGAWPTDPNAKYHIMAAELTDKNIILNSLHYFIPSHSILIGTGMQNGIIALLLTFYILIFYIQKGLFCIRNKNRYKIVTTLFMIMIIWHMLFSPITQLRLILPLYMSFILSVKQNIEYQKYILKNKI